MNWDIDVSIYGNSSIFKQIAFCFGLACLIPGVFLALVTWDIMLFYIFGWVFVGFMVVGYIVTLIFFGGKNRLSFSMDSDGVVSETREEQAKRNKIINTSAIVLGVLARKPAAVGAGMLAGARGNTEAIEWKNVEEVEYEPRSRTIILKGGTFQKLMIFCTKENYAEAAEFVKAKTELDKR